MTLKFLRTEALSTTFKLHEFFPHQNDATNICVGLDMDSPHISSADIRHEVRTVP